MTEEFVEGFSNTIEIVLKEGRDVNASDGKIISSFGLPTLDSLIGALVRFSGPLQIRCVSAKRRTFRLVFKSELAAEIYTNGSLLEANEYVEIARWGSSIWPVGPTGVTEGIVY